MLLKYYVILLELDKLIIANKASCFNLSAIPSYQLKRKIAITCFWHFKTSSIHVHPLSIKSRRGKVRGAAKSTRDSLFPTHVFIAAPRINEPRPLVIYDKQMYPARVHLASGWSYLRVAFRRASTPNVVAFSGSLFFSSYPRRRLFLVRDRSPEAKILHGKRKTRGRTTNTARARASMRLRMIATAAERDKKERPSFLYERSCPPQL